MSGNIDNAKPGSVLEPENALIEPLAVGTPLEAQAINRLEEEFLRTLEGAPFNGHAGNKSLREHLGWDDERYWMIRDRLDDAAKIVRGRGKGGSVHLLGQPQPAEASLGGTGALAVTTAVSGEDAPAGTVGGSVYGTEESLYEPIVASLRSYWPNEKRLDEFLCEVTARLGRRQTFGTWSRPDITAVSLVTYPYVPGRHFDVTTFEVKPEWEIDVRGVYEALAHLRRATQAYIIYHCPRPLDEPMKAQLTEEAERHGIGLILAVDPSDPSTWDEIAEPVRRMPLPDQLNEFIKAVLSEETKTRLIKWFR
jgi:hypothetical protein